MYGSVKVNIIVSISFVVYIDAIIGSVYFVD
jgi:hypothetical protein